MRGTRLSEPAEPLWPAPFEDAVRAHATLLGPDVVLSPRLRLVEHGLDSLATVSLLLDLEDRFGCTIPDEMLTVTMFATPADLWSVLSAAMAG